MVFVCVWGGGGGGRGGGCGLETLLVLCYKYGSLASVSTETFELL